MISQAEISEDFQLFAVGCSEKVDAIRYRLPRRVTKNLMRRRDGCRESPVSVGPA